MENVNPWVHPTIIGSAASKKGQPNKNIAGKFLGPEEGVVENISEKNLGYNDNRHAQSEHEEASFREAITGQAEFLSCGHCTLPAYLLGGVEHPEKQVLHLRILEQIDIFQVSNLCS